MPEEGGRSERQANDLYWESDQSVADIAERLGVSRRTLYRTIRPLPAGLGCSECGGGLVYQNRSARAAGTAECSECDAEQDVAAMREANAGAGAALRREAAPEAEQEVAAGAKAPLGIQPPRAPSGKLLASAAALTGVAVGAVAAFWSWRRR